MNYLNDLTVLCLSVSLPLGGLVLGRRVGVVSACWVAGALLLSMRFADRLWRTVFIEMREADKGMDMDFWLPMSFALMFLGFLFFVLSWMGLVRPSQREFTLPARADEFIAMAAGALAGVLLVLAVVQSQAMLPGAEKRLSRSFNVVRPMLISLGQKHVAPAQRPPPLREQQKAN